MNEQNIMENNEVLEVAEEVANNNSGLGWKVIGGVLVLAGTIYGGIKLRKVLKAKKDVQLATTESDSYNEVETEDVEVEEKKTTKKK